MKKKKKKITTSTNLSPLDDYHRRPCHADETDQDEESIRSEDKRNIYAQHDSTYSSSHERANLSASTTLINDDESSAFTRKQSKIGRHSRGELTVCELVAWTRNAMQVSACCFPPVRHKHRSVLLLSVIEFPRRSCLHTTSRSTFLTRRPFPPPPPLNRCHRILLAHYRHKIRSKLDTVKKQFSDQMPLSRQHGSTFEEIGRETEMSKHLFVCSLRFRTESCCSLCETRSGNDEILSTEDA